MAAFDFSSSFSGINNALANLGRQNEKAWQTERFAELGKDVQAGNYSAAASKAMGLGDVGTAVSLLGLGQKAGDRESDAALVRGLTGGGVAAPTASPLAALGNPNEIENRFVGTVKQAGLTNPVGLGAVAAYGKAESGFAPQNVNRSWSDPSESGQAGTAGGIMSWRAERLQNLQNFAKERGEAQPSVETQALFLSKEDPTLIPKLQAAQTPQEANQIMANAWRFAGYNREGGENARRLALTQQYSQRFGGQPGQAPAGPVPVQVAESEADVQRLEAQQGNPVVAPQAPVQVAQAPGAPVSDAPNMPSPDAANAQGFVIPGTGQVVDQQTLASNPKIRNLILALGSARGDAAKTTIGKLLDVELADAKSRMDTGGPLDREGKALSNAKARRELDGKGFRTLGAEERAAAGVDPSFKGVVQVDRDGQLHFPGKATTEVSVKNEGTIPAGYRMLRDAQGNPTQLEPIPGSPAAAEAAGADKKAEAQRQQTEQTGNVVINSLNDVERLMSEATLPTTGALGSRAAEIKGTAAHDIKNALTTIGANISFQNLAQMRAASPTGGALGAVSDSEQKMLQNAWGALEQSQSEGQFKTNLGRVRAIFERTVHGRTLTPQERKSGGPMTGERAKSLRDEASAAIAGGAPKDAVLKRLKDQYGITGDGL